MIINNQCNVSVRRMTGQDDVPRLEPELLLVLVLASCHVYLLHAFNANNWNDDLHKPQDMEGRGASNCTQIKPSPIILVTD